MVNRVLIRVKVVQMLYSYLLSRTEFKIDKAPDTASADKRYAYGIYTDLLMIVLELSGLSSREGKAPIIFNAEDKLRRNTVARLLKANDEMMELAKTGGSHIEAIAPVLPVILKNDILTSQKYSDYKRAKASLAKDVNFWVWVIEGVISRSDALKDALRNEGGFSSVGFSMGVAKAVETLKAYADSKDLYDHAKKNLAESLDNAYDLYLSLFALIIDLTNYQKDQQEKIRSRHLASEADRNPNTKLTDNLLVKYLIEDEDITALLDNHHLHRFDTDSPLMRSLMDAIRNSELYRKYVETPGQSLQEDAEFWRDALRTIILDNDEFLETLESQSLFWNDDLYSMGTFALKTLRKIAQSDGKKVALLPHYKDDEDERFGPELFTFAVENYDQYLGYINKFTASSSWDLERLAFMDIVIMVAAIAEAVNFPDIPPAATVNEFVDIASHYSTDRSGNFVNAILRNIINYLNDEGIINKH